MKNPESTAIVVFAHGARDARWALPLARLKAEVLRRQPSLRVEVAFLESQEPTLAQAMARLVADGCAQIQVAPVFWSMGGHVARDLPQLLAAFGHQHPAVQVEVLPVLAELPGMNEFVADALLALAGFAGPGAGPPTPARTSGESLDVAPYLREIGRGKDGSRGLARERARDLMAAMLDGTVSDLGLGAILLALRMKGEESAELAGFLEALESRLLRAAARAPAWVVLPSYNGARSIANLVPLLALLLARRGVPVLVHGQDSEPAAGTRRRVTSAVIFEKLGIEACASMAQAGERVGAGLPALVALSTFAPALSRMLALRPILGVRNVAHTLAKLVRPVQGPSLLISSYTHPAFGRLQAELFGLTRMHAMSLRATDGEAVVSARRSQGIDVWRDGVCRQVVAPQSVAAADAGLPAPDADSTAAWIGAVLAGKRPVPAVLHEQVEAICSALASGPLA